MPTPLNHNRNKINWNTVLTDRSIGFAAFYDWLLSLPEYAGRISFHNYGDRHSDFYTLSVSEYTTVEEVAWTDDLAMLIRWSKQHGNAFGAAVTTNWDRAVFIPSGMPTAHDVENSFLFGFVENGIPEYRFDVGGFTTMGEARQNAAYYIIDTVMD